jgi:hypothetical protein
VGGAMINELDMSEMLEGFEQDVILRKRTTTTVDFVPTESITDTDIMAVVQVPDDETKRAENLDYSKTYQQFHSVSVLAMNDFIIYSGTEYKIVRLCAHGDYGYYEAIGEQVK